MTVYFIYKHGNEIHPFLYAVTDKKYLKNTFMKQRKKKLFIVKEKEFTKDQFIDFCKNHSKYLLERRGFETKSSSFNSLNIQSCIYLVATEYEEMDVFTKEDEVIYSIGRYTDYIARAFNDKIIKALYELHYFEIYKYVNQIDDRPDYFVLGVDTFKMENYRIDAFGVFMYLYGNSIDTKGLIQNG